MLYLITFITSIPALALYQPVLDDPVGYVANGGSDSQIYFGALLELLLIVANIGTAVGRRGSTRSSNAEPISRSAMSLLESWNARSSVVGILAVLVDRDPEDRTPAPTKARSAVGESLAAIKDWTFLLGPDGSSGGGTD